MTGIMLSLRVVEKEWFFFYLGVIYDVFERQVIREKHFNFFWITMAPFLQFLKNGLNNYYLYFIWIVDTFPVVRKLYLNST